MTVKKQFPTQNGGSNSVFLKWIANLWGPMVAVISFVFWFGTLISDRMETPEEKERRIKRYLTPLEHKLQIIENDVLILKNNNSNQSLVEYRLEKLDSRVLAIETELHRFETEYYRSVPLQTQE